MNLMTMCTCSQSTSVVYNRFNCQSLRHERFGKISRRVFKAYY